MSVTYSNNIYKGSSTSCFRLVYYSIPIESFSGSVVLSRQVEAVTSSMSTIEDFETEQEMLDSISELNLKPRSPGDD